jgi:hypothetical protein
MEGFVVYVRDICEAAWTLGVLCTFQKFLYDEDVMGDYSNVGYVEMEDNGEWVPWEKDCEEFDWHCENTPAIASAYALGLSGLRRVDHLMSENEVSK